MLDSILHFLFDLGVPVPVIAAGATALMVGSVLAVLVALTVFKISIAF